MIALALAPDEIPAHWGLSGEADRMGSKWELLLWPGIILLLRLLLGRIEKLVREKDREGEKKRAVHSLVNNCGPRAYGFPLAVLHALFDKPGTST